VEGLTTDEVAQKIKEGLEKDYFQKATSPVTIESALAGGSSGGGVIYVIGNVNRPGRCCFPRNEQFTVTKAIIAAGNWRPSAMAARCSLSATTNRQKYITYQCGSDHERGEFERTRR